MCYALSRSSKKSSNLAKSKGPLALNVARLWPKVGYLVTLERSGQSGQIAQCGPTANKQAGKQARVLLCLFVERTRKRISFDAAAEHSGHSAKTFCKMSLGFHENFWCFLKRALRNFLYFFVMLGKARLD